MLAWALASATLSVAGHVMGKAVRDSLYLARFPVELLPWFVLGTGVLSAVAVSLYTRLNASIGPRRVVPALAAITAATLPLLWLDIRSGAPLTIAVMFAWTTISGTFLTSGFWAVVVERFDPRSARRVFGWLGVATTVGGLLAGVGAHTLLRAIEPEALLLVLAGINGLLALAMLQLGSGEVPAATPSSHAPRGGLREGIQEIRGSRYLLDIAVLVTAVTVAGALADYVLKDLASHTLSGKRELAQFFTLFHGAVGAVTLLVQVVVCRPLVAKKGLAAGLIALPLWLITGGALLIGAPLLWAAAVFRGGENAVRNSFHRAGYELLFVPVAPASARVAKPILDTLLERVADGLGAGIVLLLVGALHVSAPRLSWLVVALGALGLYTVSRIRRGYVDTLSANLAARAVELDDLARAADDDASLREAIRHTLLDVRQDALRKTLNQTMLGRSLMVSLHIDTSGTPAFAAPATPAPSRPPPSAGTVEVVQDLASNDSVAILRGIAAWDRKDRRAVPLLVDLLANDTVRLAAAKALGDAGERIAGTLTDVLDDDTESFAVRRRVARILARSSSDVAMHTLVRALADPRFELRYEAGLALERIVGIGGRKPPSPEPLWHAVRSEMKKSRAMWEAERMLDEADSPGDPLHGIVKKRGEHSLRHVFRLLGLLLDPKAIELSYRALDEHDPQFRAVGLEYLENVLPADVRLALWPLIGDDEPPPMSRSGRALEQVMRDLAASGAARPKPDV
ncbi:MAG: putative rane protein [Myxococcaceae bacterium]|nr:putative rane protein [Myxococcaceae bacterium]